MARPRVLSLFSGVGGLDLGVRLACPGARVLGYVEREAYASAVLLARMGDSSLEPAPVFVGDIQDVDGRELRGWCDLLIGGFPCQDISVAGKGAGIGGRRSGLWSEVLRLANETAAPALFLENVSAIRSASGRPVDNTPAESVRALGTVLADLAASGYDAEWLCLRASDVGAPHRRERWFCLAYCNGEQRRSNGREPHPAPNWRDNAWRRCENLAHAKNDRHEWRGDARRRRRGSADDNSALDDSQRPERWPLDECGGRGGEGFDRERKAAGRAGVAVAALDDALVERPQRQQPAGAAAATVERADRGDVAHAVRQRRQQITGSAPRDEGADERRAAEHHHELAGCVSLFPPGPADHDAWRAVLEHHPHLAPAIKPGVHLLVDGVALVVDENRSDQLRCAGNGVVPQQAARALRILADRAGLEDFLEIGKDNP